MFAPLWSYKNNIRIFTRSRDDRPLAEQVLGIFKPPYWPLELAKMSRAEMIEINDTDAFMLSEDIKVIPFAADHPDETTSFRVEADGKVLVHLPDHEVDGDASYELIEFCKNADVIVFDGAYLPEDYPAKRGWGHSHYIAGVKLAKASGCKRMIFSHLAPDYTDSVLDAAEKNIADDQFCFAYDGLEMCI
jgi:ribonuclease BN (tRNA processing enzyme)